MVLQVLIVTITLQTRYVLYDHMILFNIYDYKYQNVIFRFIKFILLNSVIDL